MFNIITPQDVSEMSFREGRKVKNNPFLALFLFENTWWVLGLRQYINKLLSFPSTVDIVMTISSWELTLKFAGLLGSTGVYVNVPPRKWVQTESCTCTRHIKRAIYISNSFILMQSWSARWSTLFAYEDVNKQRREWLILGKIYKRDRHGSSEQSEFTTNNSGLTMSRGKKVIVKQWNL